jgi:DNA-binding NtrC family response regulator
LDEIGDISPTVQAKLLRLLQEKEYEPLGSTRTVSANVRFVAATHRNLEEMIAEGAFREDLFYRIDVIPIFVPPLRDRPDDIAVLAGHFTDKLGADNDRAGLTISDEAVARMATYDWPGNVRELLNFVERLVVFSDGARIEEADVDRELGRGDNHPRSSRNPVPSAGSLVQARAEAEKQAVVEALSRAGDNRTKAARLLGVSRRKLYNLLAQFDQAT